MGDEPQSPLVLKNILTSALITIPFVGSGYAAAKYGHVWFLAAVAWYVIVGLLCSIIPDDEDES